MPANSPLGWLPLETLEAWEQLEPGPQKDFLSHKFIDTFKIALQERQWRLTKQKSAALEGAAKPLTGSLAAKYEEYSRLDPAYGRKFFEVNKEAILQEHEQRRTNHVTA